MRQEGVDGSRDRLEAGACRGNRSC
jgi:hypothetical protein